MPAPPQTSPSDPIHAPQTPILTKLYMHLNLRKRLIPSNRIGERSFQILQVLLHFFRAEWGHFGNVAVGLLRRCLVVLQPLEYRRVVWDIIEHVLGYKGTEE